VSGLPAELHENAGVRWADTATGMRLPRNYGDPAAEYDAAQTAAVVADRPDRSFLRVHGRDPIRMLQGLITNDLAGAPTNRAVYAAVLTAKGRMVADVRVLRLGPELLVETAETAAEPLTAHLRKFVPPLFARFEDASERWTVLTVLGPKAAQVLADALGVSVAGGIAEDDVASATIPQYPHIPDIPSISKGDDGDGGDGGMTAGSIIGSAEFGMGGVDLIVGSDVAPDVWRRLVEAGARPAGHATLEVLRVEAGRPRWGAELTDAVIPLEAGLRSRAISETKGCYTGQEVIIRILHRGHVNWHLRGLLLGDVQAPAQETPLFSSAGKQVGRITSAVWSPRHGQVIGLGYVRREVEPSSVLHLGAPDGPDAEVRTLPFELADG
jgi:tRNA-modifying protein YgfZ